jgi:lactose/L-arabinose transport system substrate-binding protein
MKKRVLAAAMAVTMAVSMLAGCSGNSTSSGSSKASGNSQTSAGSQTSNGDNQITVWGWDKNFNGYAMSEAAKLDSEVKVNFVEMSKADCLKKIHTVLASNVKEDLPDVVFISDLNAQGYLMSYPGAFREMSDVLNYDNFASYKISASSYQGKKYGLPFDTGVAGLFYRTDYLSQIGYTKEKMQNLTWDEYLSLGAKLKAKGHMLQTFNPNDISQFQILLQSAGTWFTDKSGNANFTNNKALREAYSIFKKLHSSNYCKVVSDWTGFAGAINSGDVACVMRGSWISSTILQGKDQSGKWAVAPIPKMSVSGATQYSNQGGSSMFVLKNSKHSDLAAKFLAKTFGSSTELYNTLLENKNIIGTFLPAEKVAAYDKGQDFYGGLKVNKTLAEWLKKIPVVETGAYSTEAQAALISVTPQYLAGGDLNKCLTEAESQFKRAVQ